MINPSTNYTDYNPPNLWMAFFLEIQLKRKLDNPRSGARRRDAPIRHWHGDVAVGIREVGPVEEVEKLRAELTSDPLPDRNELDDRKVHVLLSRTVEEIARSVSKRIVRIEVRVVWCS